MNCPGEKKFFKDVPVGSTVEVSTPGTPGDFSTVIDLIGPNDEHGAIGPGDTWVSQPLQHSRMAYLLRIIVQHNLPAVTTAGVKITVKRADGSTHSSPIVCSSTGKVQSPPDFGLWPIITA